MPKAHPPRAERALLDAFWHEPVDRSVLANGLTLLIKPDRSAALASVQVWVRTGSIHESGHLGAGLSHFLEHMLFKGTARRAGREISATVQAHGGYINAYTTFDRTVYYIDLPSEHLDVAVDVLADAVLNSSLPPEEVAREKEVILREIAMTRDDPENRLWDSLFSTAFREHPYRQPVIGHRDVFAAVDRDALLAYYKERYVPNNMVVVIAGDVSVEAARASVARHFGQAPRARLAPVLVPQEPLQLGPRALHKLEKVEIARCVLAWPIPGLADPSAPVLDLLAVALGGGESSVLWQEVREKRRLVHSIDASSWNPGTSGLFCVTFVCDAGRREEASAAILRVVEAHARPGSFTPRQVRKAYRQAVVAEINTCKTMSGQASRLGLAEVVVGDLEFSSTYFDRLAHVKAADLCRAVGRYLVPGRLVSVSLEPEAAGARPKAGGAAAAAAHGRPDFEEVRLPNGARLLYQLDRRLPNLHLRLLTLGGPLCERADRRGSSALLATLLTKDTRRHSAAQVAARIEEAGGTFSAFSGENTLGLAAEVLPADAELALGLIEEGALAPAFKAQTLRTEKEAQLAALREENDDVVACARRLLRRKFFGAHPMAVSSLGDREGVSATTGVDLGELWGRLLVAPATVLCVAGDFEPKALIPRMRELLGRIPAGAAVGAGPQFEGPAERGAFVENQPREQAIVLQGFPGAVIDAPDFYAAEVADELFSGMASRLFERVREQKSLAYFVRSGRVVGRSAAMFYFMAGTQPGREGEVLAEIGAEIARVAAGEVTQEELHRCQVRLKAGQRKALQTNASRAMQAAIDVLQGREANHWRKFDALVDAVTISDLAAFAARRLRAEAMTQLVVRP